MRIANVALLFLLLCCNVSVNGRGRRGRKPISAPVVVAKNSSEVNNSQQQREGKLFSLFSIVQFPNTPCASSQISSSGRSRNGTCFTASQCRSKGGVSGGRCAAGFGVCCVFLLSSSSGGTINQNCTYIVNPGFPGAYSATGQLQYTVNKCDRSVCYLRLDFEAFTTVATGDTQELNGGACMDTFDVTVSSNQVIPTICGQNTGQHMYVDLGSLNSDNALLSFAFNGNSNSRIWDIKVTQVKCNSRSAPPEGCLQYYTGLTGRFTTYNWLAATDNHLANQRYSACIRQEAGYCCVEYTVCASETNAFSADPTGGGTNMGQQDTNCSTDYIGLTASGGNCQVNNGVLANRYCGPFLNIQAKGMNNVPICDCTSPFSIDVFTDALADTGAADTPNTLVSRGVCLDFRQIPC